jgi:hypothetical protein
MPKFSVTVTFEQPNESQISSVEFKVTAETPFEASHIVNEKVYTLFTGMPLDNARIPHTKNVSVYKHIE